MSEIEYRTLEENPWYWLAEQGREIWNRWAIGLLSAEEIHKCNLNHLQPLTDQERKDVSLYISNKLEQHGNKETAFGESTLEYLEIDMTGIDFSKTLFKKPIINSGFRDFVFPIPCNFTDSKFECLAWFQEAKFFSYTIFNKVTFCYGADFSEASWSFIVHFRECYFKETPRYIHANFPTIRFIKCIFLRPPHLTRATGNLEITTKQLSNCTLHHTDVVAWANLKNEMSKKLLHREEADFFAKELECRALDGNWKEKILITLYRSTSDFGRSALLPLGALIYFFILFTALYEFTFFDTNGSLEYSSYLSSKAAFPFLPKTEFIKEMEIINFSPTETFFIRMIQGAQFIISATLFFLIGLGIRNRLRIK